MPRLVRPLLAIAAALTGSFSRQDAALNFLWVALGGIAVGAGITWIVGRIKLDQPTTALLEHFRRRPAGLTTGFVEGSRQPLSVVRIRRTIVWEVPSSLLTALSSCCSASRLDADGGWLLAQLRAIISRIAES